MSNKYFKIYSRIRSLREDHDLTQKKIASILNMSQTGYSKYETGENDIPTRILINLSLYYDTSIDYLLGITDVQKPYKRSKDVEENLNDEEMSQTTPKWNERNRPGTPGTF